MSVPTRGSRWISLSRRVNSGPRPDKLRRREDVPMGLRNLRERVLRGQKRRLLQQHLLQADNRWAPEKERQLPFPKLTGTLLKRVATLMRERSSASATAS